LGSVCPGEGELKLCTFCKIWDPLGLSDGSPAISAAVGYLLKLQTYQSKKGLVVMACGIFKKGGTRGLDMVFEMAAGWPAAG
jgi:hypothetical protein